MDFAVTPGLISRPPATACAGSVPSPGRSVLVEMLSASIRSRAGRSHGNHPVLDRQSWDGRQIGIVADHSAVAERTSDGCDHDVDLLHGTTDSPKLSGEPPILFGGLAAEWPTPNSAEAA
jgi:hypothetical protein